MRTGIGLESETGIDAQYRAAHNLAALFDRSSGGRLEVTGADRIEFLQRMSSNDLRGLEAGAGLQTVLTTPEARVVDLLTVFARPESLWVLTSPGSLTRVASWFRGQIFFRDKVKVADITGTWAQFSVVGPRAADLLRGFDVPQPDPARFSLSEVHFDGIDVVLASLPVHQVGSYEVFALRPVAATLWQRIVSAGAAVGLLPAGEAAFEMLRVAEGIPAYGSELSEEVNALEAGLRHAISFSKGCYTGQEVIARLDTYQKQKQALVRLRLDAAPVSGLPLPIERAGTAAGELTSAVRLPGGLFAGLGFVRLKELNIGGDFEVVDGGGRISATITSDPTPRSP